MAEAGGDAREISRRSDGEEAAAAVTPQHHAFDGANDGVVTRQSLCNSCYTAMEFA